MPVLVTVKMDDVLSAFMEYEVTLVKRTKADSTLCEYVNCAEFSIFGLKFRIRWWRKDFDLYRSWSVVVAGDIGVPSFYANNTN